MRSYRELEIFVELRKIGSRNSFDVAKTLRYELYEEDSQIRRSSKAIASSIVEDYGRRRYKADFVKYLNYAQTECDETILHLDFLQETGSLSEGADSLRTRYDSLSKQINKFIQWVGQNWQPGTGSMSAT